MILYSSNPDQIEQANVLQRLILQQFKTTRLFLITYLIVYVLLFALPMTLYILGHFYAFPYLTMAVKFFSIWYEVVQMKSKGMGYVHDIWNIADLLQICVYFFMVARADQGQDVLFKSSEMYFFRCLMIFLMYVKIHDLLRVTE